MAEALQAHRRGLMCFFQREEPAGRLVDVRVRCRYCPYTIRYKAVSMRFHLATEHAGVQEVEAFLNTAAQQPLKRRRRLAGGAASAPAPDPAANGHGDLVSLELARFLIELKLPASIVEKKSFRRFVGLLNPNYVVPTVDEMLHKHLPAAMRDAENHVDEPERLSSEAAVAAAAAAAAAIKSSAALAKE